MTSSAATARVIPFSDDLNEAKRVLQLESEAIQALGSGLDQAFSQAVDCFDQIQGRVVVTGMGKSGHIARKLAATFASTGTPSFFVHPAEASHGDLGMITRQDAVLALSNSGETAELSNILRYSRRYRIPLVAMTGGASSNLASLADITLEIPDHQEACPIGLAPTTSTIVMLALGDALACVLLKRKNFSADDFGQFHPSGALGRRLLTVGEIMHTGDRLPFVTEHTSVGDALLVMTEKSLGCVGVLDASQDLVGIVTDGDLRRHMNTNLLQLNVNQIMSSKPKTIRPQALVVEALALMNQHSITGLFVVCGPEQKGYDKSKFGFVHIHDCLQDT